MSALFSQCPGDTVQTGTGKVDPARKFKCTTAARVLLALEPCVAQGSHGWFRRLRVLGRKLQF